MKFTIFGPLPELRNCSKAEAGDFFSWFLSIVPERLELLPHAVRRSFASWQADYTPESLNVLGEWFAQSVTTRPRTGRESEEILSKSPYPIDVPKYELTDQTFAACYDVGIYLAEIFRHRDPRKQWQQVLGNKRQIYFGQPTLSGFGKIDFSPIHLAIVLAYGIAEKKDDDKGLRALFDIWAKLSVGYVGQLGSEPGSEPN